VDLETVYWGQDWTQPANQTDQQNLDNFAKTMAQSSYLSMLGEYGVGTGSWSKNDIVTNSQSPANGGTVSDADIENMLANEIRAGNLHESTGQQVYLVYLPPGVHSSNDEHVDLAHHASFTMQFRHSGYNRYIGWYSYSTTDTVPFAVIPDPSTNSGTNPSTGQGWGWNTHLPGNSGAGDISAGWTNFQKQTEVSSHELAEALTNPAQYQDGSGTWHGGWWDGTTGNEIGDIANLDATYMDGYIVQREYSNYFGRDIAPFIDTYGNPWGFQTYTSNGNTYMYSWYISNGREQGFGSYGITWMPQYTWWLPDGSISGYFTPDYGGWTH
jgi:hypothetical protein